MANVRINIFKNYPTLHRVEWGFNEASSSLWLQGLYIPGSISFNQVAVIASMPGVESKSITVSFGLYSLNGSSLSLANSASLSSSMTNGFLRWLTFQTSATQDITPGNWYFGMMSSTAGTGSFSLLVNNATNIGIVSNVIYNGNFVRGAFSATTTAFPASIATSDLIKEPVVSGDQGKFFHPYILISA